MSDEYSANPPVAIEAMCSYWNWLSSLRGIERLVLSSELAGKLTCVGPYSIAKLWHEQY